MIQITGVDFHRIVGRHTNASKVWLLVRLQTNEPGLEGWGEGSASGTDLGVIDLVQQLVPMFLVGRDPFPIELTWYRMREALDARNGRVATTAISALDIALWDLKGKMADKPVYELLGGALRRSVGVYANGWYTAEAPSSMLADEAQRMVEMGHQRLKFDPFDRETQGIVEAPGISKALERVRAVRERVGPDVDLLIEAHGRFHPSSALMVIERCAEYQPRFVEEPIPPDSIEAMGGLRSRSPVPIAAGERLHSLQQFATLFRSGGVDVIQPDVVNAGGLTALRKIDGLGEAFGASFAPHTTSSPVGAMAALHIEAASANTLLHEWHADSYGPEYREGIEGFPLRQGSDVQLPDRPGLGLEISVSDLTRRRQGPHTRADGLKDRLV